MNQLTKALREAFRPALDEDAFTSLVKAADENEQVVKQVVAKERRMDRLLCLNCGPYRAMLRQRRLRQAGAQGAA